MSTARYAEWNLESATALIAPIVASEPGPVLLCLQAVQSHFGYVPNEATALVSDICNVSRADVYGVLTFYSDLRTSRPPAVPDPEQCNTVGVTATSPSS